MSSIGTGYDYSATTYSPDGRIFQVEYAEKAVENSGTVIGLRVKDGVVLGVEKLLVSKLLTPGSNRRIAIIDPHVGMAGAGLAPDTRQITIRAKEEASQYRSVYGCDMPLKVLVDHVGSLLHLFTIYSSVRPFGVSSLFASFDRNGPQLYAIEPSGSSFGCFGYAVGKGRQAAKIDISKLRLSELTAREALVEVAKIIHRVHDEQKDKRFELELGWVCEETNRKFEMVPEDVLKEAERQALADIEAESDDEA